MEDETEAFYNRVICRRQHAVGWNRAQRICMTRREWINAEEASERGLARAMRPPPETINPGRPDIIY